MEFFTSSAHLISSVCIEIYRKPKSVPTSNSRITSFISCTLSDVVFYTVYFILPSSFIVLYKCNKLLL